MDFKDLEKEELFTAEGSQITVWSGGKAWPAKPEEIDLTSGFFLHKEKDRLVMGRIDWIVVGPKDKQGPRQLKNFINF